MKLRLRHVLLAPRSGELPALATALFVVVAALFYWAFWRWGIPPNEVNGDFTRPLLLMLLICAGFYGIARALCHPVFNPRYLRWLATTPWRPPMPLPLDPPSPVWQDGAQVAIFAALGVFVARCHPALPVLVLLIGYLLGLAAMLLITGQSISLVAVVVMVPLTFHLWGKWWMVVGVLSLVCLVALHGMRRAWHGFPWDMGEPRSKIKIVSARASLGWPFERLNMPRPSPHAWHRWVAMSVIAGWYNFSVWHCIHDPVTRDPYAAAAMMATMGCLAAFLRLVLFRVMRNPPMSFLGRIVTGNLVLPGHDRVLIAPLIVAFTAVVGSAVLCFARVYPPLLVGIMTTVILALAFCLPSTLRNWELTGQYRMVAVKPRASYGA